MKNQKQLLSLFHNLIKLYHDGIVISTNDNIVLYNKQTAKIFRVNQEQLFNENFSLKNVPNPVDFFNQQQAKSAHELEGINAQLQVN
jgi:transcriptional regulator with PAS, ATPase and Fis domain